MIRVTFGSGDFIIGDKVVTKIEKVFVTKTKVKMCKGFCATHLPKYVDCYFEYKGVKCVLRVDNPLHAAIHNGGWKMIPGRHYTFRVSYNRGPYVAFTKLEPVLRPDRRHGSLLDKDYEYNEAVHAGVIL